MTAILIHGFNESNVAGTVGKLRPYFEDGGYEVQEVNYGWSGLVRVRFCNRGIALAIAALAPAGAVGVGHSNGCAILQRASMSGAKFDQLVFINPALDRKAEVGPQVKRIHVWHSPGELPTRIASLFFDHSWGDMGAFGYAGGDPRFVNYNVERDFVISARGHSDVFSRGKVEFFGPRIVALCRNT